MAMTLRLDSELDAKLAALAAERRMSKQQMIVHAVEKFMQEEAHAERVQTAIDRVIAENEGLLRRLAST